MSDVKPKAEWVKLAIATGRGVHKVQGYRFGVWAATPAVRAVLGRTVRAGPWTITHTPSGVSIPGVSVERADAIAIARHLGDECPTWQEGRAFGDFASVPTRAEQRQVFDAMRTAAPSWTMRPEGGAA